MTAKPHLIFGLFAGAVLTSTYQMADAGFASYGNLGIALVATSVGSLAPDIDAPGSPIARALWFAAEPIQRRWPHRTLVHSLVGAFIASFIVYCAMDVLTRLFPISHNSPFVVWLFFLNAYLGHLLVDSLTITGVKWLWPFQRAFAFPTSRRHRIRTGDKKPERYFMFLFLGLFLLYVPVLTAGGAARSIHRTFKNFGMARADYLRASGIETFLSFEGSFRHNRLPVSGRSVILDATEQHFIIFKDGAVLTIGDQAIVLGTEYVCEYTQAAPHLLEFTVINQSMDSILTLIPNDVLVSGKLVSGIPFQANAPLYANTDFEVITMTTTSIGLNYASKADIAALNIRISETIRKQQERIRTLQADSSTIATKIDSITIRLGAIQSLIGRYELRKQLTELNAQLRKLETNLASRQYNSLDIEHSDITLTGKLVLRKLHTQKSDRR